MSKPDKRKHAAPAPLDPYLPGDGNAGYRVSRYDLELEYKVSSNRLSGRATITMTTTSESSRLSLDLSHHLTVSKVTINGSRAGKFHQRADKLTLILPSEVPPGTALIVTIRYAGSPRPIRGPWGEVGWEELSEGVLVASQPNGAPSWFPCNDHPSAKASYRVELTTDSPFFALANGRMTSRRVRAAQTTWVYEQSEPMSSYLATVQIGPYEHFAIDTPHGTGGSAVPIYAAVPPRLRHHFANDFARQRQMMELFVELFGPYPFDEYAVVVTDDELEIPIEAQGLSIFGANHCDGQRGWERLVAHELAHQWFGNSVTVRMWRDIWLHEGFACYAEWLWSERSGGPSADRLARSEHARLAELPQDLLLADPGPQSMFDDRVYKRGALTLHTLRRAVGDPAFFGLLREWSDRFRYGCVATEDFTDLAAHRHPNLAPLWDLWLYRRPLPPLG